MVVGGLLSAAPAQAADRAFESRFSTNQPGDIAIVSNTALTCPTAAANCTAAQNGAGTGSRNNNDFSMGRVDVDSDAGTAMSSRSTLAMPSGAKVLFAGLYWYANSNSASRNSVKFQAPGESGYTTLTATTLDASTTTNWYQGFADVTDRVRAAGNGVYTTADITLTTGNGQAGGWALVVAYNDPAQPPRNLSVFDGITAVPPTPNTITVKGFRTPPTGAVKTTLGVVSVEGDASLVGDGMSLNSTALSDSLNPKTNPFNSTISTLGADAGGRTPNYTNQLGMDADLFNADGILGNNATSATIKLTTVGDVYLPGVVSFSTELYAPIVVPTKTVQNLTNPGTSAQEGDTLRYSLSFQNNGQDDADGFVATDSIPAGATYKPGSLQITAGPNAPASPTDGAGDDLAEFDSSEDRVRFRMGTGANATDGGSVAQGGGTVTATFDVTVDGGHKEGDVITNRGSSDYRGQTTGVPFLDQQTPEVETPVRVPDMTLSKTHSPAFVSGGNTTFTLIASNVGDVSTNGGQVTVTDTFPSGAAGFDSIQNAEGSGWNCSVAGLTLTCTRSDVLGAGQSYPPIIVDARVHDPIAATIVNNATVSGGGENNTANNSATDSAGATAQADVQVAKRTTTPKVSQGDEVEWVVDVRNAGPSTAANVTLADNMPGGDYDQVEVETTQGTCDTTVSCNLGSIVAGGTATVTIRARVLANDTTLTNVATGTTTTTDPRPTNNSGQADLEVDNTADVLIEKTGGPANPAINTPYSYSLSVGNDGPGTATDVEIVDQLPTALDNPIVIPAAGWTCNAPGTGGTLKCTRATLAVGPAAPAVTIAGTIAPAAAGTLFGNTAGVTTSSRDPDPGDNTDSTTELATPSADLGVTKQFDTDTGTAGVQNDPVNPGDTVSVVLNVTNNGPTAASSATLDDVFPAGLDVTAVTGAGCAEGPANQVTCNFGTLNSGDTRAVTVTATVLASAANTTVTNTATVDSATPDHIPSNDSDRDELSVLASADISMSKTADVTDPAIGDTVTYTLTATNNGPSGATGVSISDQLPSSLSFVSASAGCNEAGGTVTCSPALGTLANGANASFTITVTVVGGAGTTVANNAEATSATTDPDPTNNKRTAPVRVKPRADLELEKTVDDATPDVEADDRFTLKVTNHGPNTAENVVISDPLPAGMIFVDASPGCDYDGTTVTCDIGTLANNESATRTITMRAPVALAEQARTNSATVTTTTTDPTPGNNDANANFTIGKRVDLAVNKTVSPGTAAAGGNASYTIGLTNNGPSAATNVELDDPLPAGLELVSATPSQGNCTSNGNQVECDLGTIASGGGAQVVITVRPAASVVGRRLENTATVRASEPEVRLLNNRDSAPLDVTAAQQAQGPQPDLRVTKTLEDRTPMAAKEVDYTIVVENRGTGTARNVVMTDTFSAPVYGITVKASQGKCPSKSPIRCELGDIGPGGRVTIRLTVRPRQTGRLRNSVVVTSPDAAAVLATVDARVGAGPAKVSVRKSPSRSRAGAGDTIRFTIRVRSHGPNSARNVRVCDPLPSGLTYVSARGASFRNGEVCWRIDSLAKRRQRTFVIVTRAAKLPRTRNVRNTARVSADAARTAREGAQVRVLGAPSRQGGVTG